MNAVEKEITEIGDFVRTAMWVSMDVRKEFRGDFEYSWKEYNKHSYIADETNLPVGVFLKEIKGWSDITGAYYDSGDIEGAHDYLVTLENILSSDRLCDELGIAMFDVIGTQYGDCDYSPRFKRFCDVVTILGAGFSIIDEEHNIGVWFNWFNDSYEALDSNGYLNTDNPVFYEVAQVATTVNAYHTTIKEEKRIACEEVLKRFDFFKLVVFHLLDFCAGYGMYYKA